MSAFVIIDFFSNPTISMPSFTGSELLLTYYISDLQENKRTDKLYRGESMH